jgi:hypothetical protein
VGVWKYIKRGWVVFSSFVRYEMGNRFKIKFWHELWCGDQPLGCSGLSS